MGRATWGSSNKYQLKQTSVLPFDEIPDKNIIREYVNRRMQFSQDSFNYDRSVKLASHNPNQLQQLNDGAPFLKFAPIMVHHPFKQWARVATGGTYASVKNRQIHHHY